MNCEIIFQLPVRLQIPSLVCCVLVNHIGTVVLEISKGQENDIASNDPNLIARQYGRISPRKARVLDPETKLIYTHFLPHLPSDLTQSCLPILTFRFYPSITQHLHHLGVFCKMPSSAPTFDRRLRERMGEEKGVRSTVCPLTLPILLEDQLSFVVVAFVLSPSTILPTL